MGERYEGHYIIPVEARPGQEVGELWGKHYESRLRVARGCGPRLLPPSLMLSLDSATYVVE